MLLPALLNPIDSMLIEIHIDEILETNNSSNLILTKREAVEMIETRNHLLTSYDRLELGIDVIKKLIVRFNDSKYINQGDYMTILNDLQKVFYYTKNETEDSICDDEIIDVMYYYFNNTCEGSISLLQGREMESYTKTCRRNNQIHDFHFKGDK